MTASFDRHPGLLPGSTLLLGIGLALATPALADSDKPPAEYANKQLADPAREAEARGLMQELRCLVCQGQAIVDSDAEMAGDMRSMVRKRIAAGESAADVRKSLIASYGDYVTYDPPFSALTAPLWLLPLILIGIGAWVARSMFRRRRG